MGFELGSLGPQAGVLPIEPPLLVMFNLMFLLQLYKQIRGQYQKRYLHTGQIQKQIYFSEQDWVKTSSQDSSVGSSLDWYS